MTSISIKIVNDPNFKNETETLKLRLCSNRDPKDLELYFVFLNRNKFILIFLYPNLSFN